MAIDQEAMVDPRLLAKLVTQYEVEQFYYEEAALLDAHKYAEWVELFADDTHYFMPIRRTRSKRELDKEFTKPGEMAYFDDDKMMLNGRALKFASGTSWAEDPPSRTRHMVHNVRVVDNRGVGCESGVFVQILQSNVRRQKRHIQRALLLTMRESVSHCYVTTPYFLPPHKLKQAMIQAERAPC